MAYKYNPIAGQLDLVTDLTFTSITAGLGYTPVNVAGDTMLGSLILDADPTTALGAATKQYVDNLAIGLNFHTPVVAATTAPLPSVIYNNGIAGVGATLIATAPGALTMDTVSFTGGERVLIKDQVSGLENGIYVVNVPGDGLTPFELERATDADNSPSGELVYGDFCFVQQGLNNGGLGYILNTVGTITVGTTPISYVVFNAAQVVTAGYGLQELTPNVLSVDTSVILDVATAALTYYPLSSNPAGYLTSGSVFGTTGSVLFAGASGILSQDNTNFFWDDANNRLGIGTNTPTVTLNVNGDATFIVGTSTNGIKLQGLVGGTTTPAMYFAQAVPSATNYVLNSTSALTRLNATSIVDIRISDTNKIRVEPYNINFNIANSTSGALTAFKFEGASNATGQTASTNIQGFLFTPGARQWATGAITTQQEFLISSPTYSFVGASTITNAYSLYVNAPTPGTNATITNNYALGINGNFRIEDGSNLVVGIGTGTKIGTATSQKLGFFNATPIAQPPAVTTTQGIADTLTNLGLLASSTIGSPAPNVQTITSASTVTPTSANDEVTITAQAVALTLADPSGTPSEGQAMTIRIKDNGTSQTIAYGSQYRALGVSLPANTTVSKTLYLGLIYNSTDTKWDVVGVSLEGSDPYTGSDWIDYSGTSTIIGWSTFTTKVIRYRIVGKQVFFNVNISGTSNSTSATFTLPFTSLRQVDVAGYGINNTINGALCLCEIGASTSLATAYFGVAAWTASGTKIINFQLFIEIA